MDLRKLDVHAAICDELKELYHRKNADYGDSFADARVKLPGYTQGKLYDKLNRFINLSQRGEQTALVDESLDDTLMDLANYAIMELTERRMAKMRPLQRLSDLTFGEGGGLCDME